MENIIVEYINSAITLEGDVNIKFFGRSLYYEDVEKHLKKMFRLNEYIIEGYLIVSILQKNPDFMYHHWRWKEKPPEPEWVIHGPWGRFVGGIDPANVNDDFINAMIYALRDDAIVEIVHPNPAERRNLGR